MHVTTNPANLYRTYLTKAQTKFEFFRTIIFFGGDVMIVTELLNNQMNRRDKKKRESDDPLEKFIALNCFDMCKVLLQHIEGIKKRPNNTRADGLTNVQSFTFEFSCEERN